MAGSRREFPLITETSPKSPVTEAYRMLRTNIDFTNFDGDMRVIVISSAQKGEGKSTTAANLAVTYAQTDKEVLLIDADLRRPALHRFFGLSNRTGLSTVLSRQQQLSETILETAVDRLHLLPSGPTPPNPAEMLGSNHMAEVLAALKDRFDLIIVDTPPVLAVTDAALVAAKCDGVVLVADSGQIKRDLARKAKQALERSQARILGVVLNNVPRKNRDSYYYYYYGDS